MTFKELYTELEQLHIMAEMIDRKEGDIGMFEPTFEDLMQEQYELEQSSLIYPEDVDLMMDEQQKKREKAIDSIENEINELKTELLQKFGGDKELASTFLDCCSYPNILTFKTLEYLSDNIPDEPVTVLDIKNLIGRLERTGEDVLCKYCHIPEADWEEYIDGPEALENYILKNSDLIERFLEIPEIQVTIALTLRDHGNDMDKIDQILATPKYPDFTDGRDEGRDEDR